MDTFPNLYAAGNVTLGLKNGPNIPTLNGAPLPSEGSPVSSVCPKGRAAMATVTVRISEALTMVQESQPDMQPVVDIEWSAGNAEGIAQNIDCTRGTRFTLPFCDKVLVRCKLLGTLGGNPLRFDVLVTWHTSTGSQPPFIFSRPITLVAGAVSSRLEIPMWARSLVVFSNTPAGLPALNASFYSSPAVGVVALYSTTNPNANATPVGGGATHVDFLHATVGQIITPMWELWL